MSIPLANFLFEAANFLVLAVALGWVVFRPLRRALDRERERRAAEETEASRSRSEADRLLAEARKTRDGLSQEMKKRRADLLEEAKREAHRIREEARDQRAAELRKISSESEAARLVPIGDLAAPVGRIAGVSVQSLLETLDGPSLDEALVRAACRQLRHLPREDGGPVTVEAARSLTPPARRMLVEVLGEGFAERVVEDLGAGVRVTTAAGQVDASASAVARQAADRLSEAFEGAMTASPGEGGSE